MALRLVVGLGNPGSEYSKTRHNAGFWFCERLADELKAALNRETRFKGRVGKVGRAQDGGHDLWLLLPHTFMNRSGESVRALAQFYRIEPAEMLVVHDELDLPPGGARLKFGGGLGGHNGLKDIALQLGTQDFWRLRIGIGHPGVRDEVVDYVLNPPRKEEAAAIEAAINHAMTATPQLLAADFEAAMRIINARRE